MNRYTKSLFISLFFVASLISWSQDKAGESQGDPPVIITAKNKPDDPYYPYITRPILNSGHDLKPPLDKAILDYIKSHVVQQPAKILPWTILPPFKDDLSKPFKLKDVVIDRIKDGETGKNYVKLYHGTTSDLVDVFKDGAKAIRFDLAERTALGMGFYVTADINEAKNFACTRLRLRKEDNKEDSKDLNALLLVVGVLEPNDKIKGRLLEPKTSDLQFSNEETGEALDENIYFVRNAKRYNQFLLFKNIEPYLKIFSLVTLPPGFGKSKNYQDYDGLPPTSTEPILDKKLKCAF